MSLPFRHAFLVAAFAIGLIGCTGQSVDRCTAGRVVECPCLGGGAGVQQCLPDGTFSACMCLPAPDSSVVLDGSSSDVNNDGGPSTDGAPTTDVTTPPDAMTMPSPTNAIDMLVEVDNSNSMRENQTNLMAQLGPLLAGLQTFDLHIGVVSTDLGTPGSSIPGCANSDVGDDGLLNPIRYGQALARHEPWTMAPPTFGRPTDCTDPNQYPSFITFTSGTTDTTQFTHDFKCNAGLYVNGCGLESQLDAIYRALVIHDASDTVGNTSQNAGFLRADALLAILVLSDEEDGSVRDCRYANGTPCDGTGAIDVYNPASSAWASSDLNLRFYRYAPCGPQDPTWPLSRYVDPANPNRGLLGLKPGHPERIVFAAITGVPLAIPMTGEGPTARVDWNGLLGTPGGGDPDDFCARNSSGLGNLSSTEGPVSMMQANADPSCSQRVVPACRREGSTYNASACTSDVQYFAWPSRRIVEVARRFAESPLCAGGPCGNGFVASICSSNYAGSLSAFAQRIAFRSAGH